MVFFRRAGSLNAVAPVKFDMPVNSIRGIDPPQFAGARQDNPRAINDIGAINRVGEVTACSVLPVSVNRHRPQQAFGRYCGRTVAEIPAASFSSGRLQPLLYSPRQVNDGLKQDEGQAITS